MCSQACRQSRIGAQLRAALSAWETETQASAAALQPHTLFSLQELRRSEAARLPGLVVQDLEALAIVLWQVRDHRYTLFYPRDHIVRLHQSRCSQHSL